MSQSDRESNHNEIQKALRELVAPALEVFIKQKMQEKLGEDWFNNEVWSQFFKKLQPHSKKGNEPNWSDLYVLLTIISNEKLWTSVFQLQGSSDGKDFDTSERGLVNILLGIRRDIAHPKNTRLDKFDNNYTLLAFDVMARLLNDISAPQAPKAEELKQEFFKKYYTELSGTTRKSIEAGINWLSCCTAMLEKWRDLTTNSLSKFTAGVEFDLDDNYIRLGFVEWKQLEKRDKKDASPKNGSELYEPKGIPIDHDTFFLEVLKQGKSKKSKNNNGKRIAIIGEPGAGKTTQLQEIAFWVLKETECLPIWISLSQLQGKTIEEYLLKVWLKTATRSVRVTDEMEEALVELFNSGRVWLLLDGVDEMVSSSGNALKKISEQLEGWVASAQVVLTCRLNVWDANKNALCNFDVYQKSNFTQEQVSQFISNWFKDNLESGQRLESELKQSRKEGIRDLIKNPLRLALLCLVWKSGKGELPDTKAELYEQYINKCYLWKNEIFRADEPLQEALKKALGELAIQALECQKLPLKYQESPFLLRKSFVCNVMNKFDQNLFDTAKGLGLLNRVGDTAEKSIEEVYAFYHSTFQEYFAALNIGENKNWDYFLNPAQGTYRIFEPQWKEVILFWLGLPEDKVSSKQKKEFIDALVNFNDGFLNQPFYGYKWVPLDEYDQEHQRSFVNFKDSLANGSFYSFQAFFLAAAGIAEFKNSVYEEVIVKRLVRWGFGYFNDEKLEWYFCCHPIAQAARNALKETDSKKAIQEISNLLKSLTANNDQFWESTLFMRTIQHIATLMGEIGTNNDEAIDILIKMLQTCTSSYTLGLVAESLSKIAIGNTKVIAKLIDMMEEFSTNQISHTASILCRIAKVNSNGIKKLITQLKETNNPRFWEKAAWVLGEIGANNQDAIDILDLGIQLDWLRNQDIHYEIAEDLLKIAPQHEKAKQIVAESNWPKTKEKNADNSGKTEYEILDEEKLVIINSDDESLYPPNDKPNDKNIVEKRWKEVAEALKNVKDAKEVEAIIIPWINLMADFINWDEAWASAVSRLEEFVDSSTSPVFSWLIDTCFNMLDADENLDVHDQAVQTLKNLLSKFNSNELYEDILKKLAPDFNYKNNFGSYEACYEVLWHCVQNMAYVDFKGVWPKPGTNIHPEVVEITPIGNNTQTQKLILANLPQFLKLAIADDHNLNQKFREICINASEFIKEHRDNPAEIIYAEMVIAHCPERLNGGPETMQSLQAYCKLLKSNNKDKKVVLIFYDSTALEPEPIGFSNSFLDALSKFGKEICVVTDQPVKKLQQFSPSQPQLIENILGWMRAIALENH